MVSAAKTKPRREDLHADEVLCDHCTAKCCRYFALPIETPEEWADYEFIRWYVLHQKATIFCEDNDWYLMVHSECRHLREDHRCGIYTTRPQICRDYTTENCEYEDDWTYERYWETPEQIFEYAEAVAGARRGPKIRSEKPPLLPVLL